MSSSKSNSRAVPLTVPHTSGQTSDSHRHIVMTGNSSPTLEAHISRADHSGFFVPVRKSKDNGRAVWETARSAGPRAGLLTRTVPSTRLAADERSKQPLLEDSIMAYTATSTGKIRPQSTQLLNADGTESSIHWVREQTVIKRIRRELAKRNHSLKIHSEGTQARDEHGQYVVLDEHQEVLSANCRLPELARFLNVLADNEVIEPPAERGWRYHIARKHSEISEGQNSVWLERESRDFRTERAARKALEAMENWGNLVIIGEASEDSTERMAAQWEREQQARQTEALAEIETAIEANPVLRHLRSEAGCPITWGRAVEIDRQLQQDRQWAGKPVAERFAEVVNRLADLGLVAVESEVSAHG